MGGSSTDKQATMGIPTLNKNKKGRLTHGIHHHHHHHHHHLPPNSLTDKNSGDRSLLQHQPTSTIHMSTKKITTLNKNKKGRLTHKAMSFHGHSTDQIVGTLRRPRTLPELYPGRVPSSPTVAVPPKLTKLLLNVMVQRSLGPLQVLISPESTVRDLIADALRIYVKEGRRPMLQLVDPSGFGLHYSQFSLESLDPDEKLIELGSRNFFLCPKQTVTDTDTINVTVTTSSTCSEEVESVTKTSVSWLRFMSFLQ